MSLTHLRQNFWSVLNCTTIFVNYGVNVNIYTLIKKKDDILMKTLQFAKWTTTKMSKPAYCKPYMQYLINYVKFYLPPNHIHGMLKWMHYLLRTFFFVKFFVLRDSGNQNDEISLNILGLHWCGDNASSKSFLI